MGFHTVPHSILQSTTHGVPGTKFHHARGVRQGDPLSPMLFILAMGTLQRLLDLATGHNVLTQLPLAAAKWRTSMYTDNAAIFINPKKEDMDAIKNNPGCLWQGVRPKDKHGQKLNPSDQM
jgi:hypothetical protein